TDYRKDPSIAYSDQVITFTAVIELDQATGQLICTDMFYGYLNDQGQNVRYKDQYTGWENKDENWVPTAADFPAAEYGLAPHHHQQGQAHGPEGAQDQRARP
ncbi:hypothetical protein PZH32_12595, partial [Adlercreutzia equolifaciens]|uniref:hypothetical protein n=1 Tax=Adlercreutzia equolifaciens TaxID=446660 RepID=UPI0023B12FAB